MMNADYVDDEKMARIEEIVADAKKKVAFVVFG